MTNIFTIRFFGKYDVAINIPDDLSEEDKKAYIWFEGIKALREIGELEQRII